jgi:hypothetical protein
MLEQELEKLVRDPARRAELGRCGREYVEREWSYEALAPRYDALHQEVWRHNRLWHTLHAKWRDFAQGDTRYRVGTPLTGQVLREWVVHSDPFLNMRRIDAGVYGQPPFDAHGVPRMFYNGHYVEHPGVVALYALNAFHCLLVEPQNPRHKARFLDGAVWLRDHVEIDAQGVGRLFYPFPAVGRKLGVPWVSCFSQSLGLSILLRAEQIMPGEGFGQAATAVAALFPVPVQDAGILWQENGLVYLEEYPENPPAHVLNGFVTGMFGLHEYYRATGQEWARLLFQQCVHTLTQILEQYEAAAGLRYDLQAEAVVNSDYYYFIIQQMRALYQITGERLFQDYARQWARRMYRRKISAFVKCAAPL